MIFNFAAFTLLILLNLSSYALIFENDKRTEVYQSQNSKVKDLAKSVFTFIPKNKLIKNSDNQFEFKQKNTLKDSINLCAHEPFSDQISVGTRCSGFLADKSYGVTAGHCVSPALIPNFCQDYYIIFDYIYQGPNEHFMTLKPNSVRECDKIQKIKFDPSGEGDDYAVLQFKDHVVDRPALKMRKIGKISNKSKLFMLGYPRGMAQKISLDGQVISNTDSTVFSTDLDCFHGNSGSPVFNAKTLLVEGLFIRGAGNVPQNSSDPNLVGDFFSNPILKCNQSLICKRKEGCDASMEVLRANRVSLDK